MRISGNREKAQNLRVKNAARVNGAQIGQAVGVSRASQPAQDEFAFVVHLPGPRVVAARVVQRLRGKAPVAPPPVRYCEMKPSLLIREAAQDLGVSEKTVENMLDDGTLRAFGVGRGHEREHKRVDSASVSELIASAWKGAVTRPPNGEEN